MPWTALTATGSKPAVWIVDPKTNTASLKPVTVGAYEAGAVLIKEGLEAGDRVVVDGGKLLSSGQPVTFGEIDHENAISCRRKHHRLGIGDGRMQAGGEGAGARPARAVDRPATGRYRGARWRLEPSSPATRPISASACWGA